MGINFEEIDMEESEQSRVFTHVSKSGKLRLMKTKGTRIRNVKVQKG